MPTKSVKNNTPIVSPALVSRIKSLELFQVCWRPRPWSPIPALVIRTRGDDVHERAATYLAIRIAEAPRIALRQRAQKAKTSDDV